MEENSCKTCGALLSELPEAPNLTSWGKPTDESHPNIIEKTCECCGRKIHLFSQNVKQVRFCPDCPKKCKAKKKQDTEGPLFAQAKSSWQSGHQDRKTTTREAGIMGPVKTFRDAVHGDIDLYEWEVQIIDTPAFQRLRGVKQLGLANYVYPSAVHTRFEHSIGTLYMAQKIVDTLKQKASSPIGDQRNVEVIRLVALLHDIGHLPFGHTIEDETKLIDTRHDQWQRVEKYIGLGTDIGTILVGKQRFDEVASVLKQLGKDKEDGLAPLYIADIVGNTVCADLLDYLIRDGYHCGLNFNYDERLLKYFDIDPHTQHLVVHLEKGGEFRRDNISELIGLLTSRYGLAEKVIFHHTKLAASAMLARAIQSSGLKESDILYWREDDLLTELSRNGNPMVEDLIERLRNRKLHKLMFRVASDYAQLRQTKERLSQLLHNDPEYRETILRALEKQFSMQEGSLCLYCPGEKMLFKSAQVMVLHNSSCTPEPLSKIRDPAFESDITSLEKKHRGLWTLQIFLNEDQYPKAVIVAEGFKRLMAEKHQIQLENDLDARPTKRWQDMKLRHQVIEQFATDKNLGRQHEQHLHLELEKYSVAARTLNGDVKNIENQYRQACEAWHKQFGGV